MVFTIVEICAALFALLYTSKIRKPLTKLISVFLALSSLLQFDTLIGVGPYALYLFALVSLVAAAECFNSLNLKVRHRAFFVITAFLIVLVELEHLFTVPFKLENPVLALIFFVVAGFFFLQEKRKIKSRLAIIVLWSAYFLNWLTPWYNSLRELL